MLWSKFSHHSACSFRHSLHFSYTHFFQLLQQNKLLPTSRTFHIPPLCLNTAMPPHPKHLPTLPHCLSKIFIQPCFELLGRAWRAFTFSNTSHSSQVEVQTAGYGLGDGAESSTRPASPCSLCLSRQAFFWHLTCATVFLTSRHLLMLLLSANDVPCICHPGNFYSSRF